MFPGYVQDFDENIQTSNDKIIVTTIFFLGFSLDYLLDTYTYVLLIEMVRIYGCVFIVPLLTPIE